MKTGRAADSTLIPTVRGLSNGVHFSRVLVGHQNFAKLLLVVYKRGGPNSSRVYRASYDGIPGRPFLDLAKENYKRVWHGEKVPDNKLAPTIPIGERLLAILRRRQSRGETEVCPAAGDCKKAFTETVKRARVRYPTLFFRDDGTPKVIVRHTLRHTGITWMAIHGVDAFEICKWAGITMEMFDEVYAHHNHKYMEGIKRAHRKPDRNGQKLSESDRNARN